MIHLIILMDSVPKGALGNDPNKRNKDSNINFGINYNYNRNFQFGLSFIKGNTINFNFTLGEIFTKKNAAQKDMKSYKLTSFDKNKDMTFYEDLLVNLKCKSSLSSNSSY